MPILPMVHSPFNSNFVRAFLFTGICLLGWVTCVAQIYVGPKINLHHSWIRIDDKALRESTEMNARLGFGAGGAFLHPMTRNLNLYGELGYTLKGKDSFQEDFDISDVASYHFAGARLAMLIELGQGAIKPYLGLGPVAEYWFGGSGEYQVGALNVSDPLEVDYTISFDAEDSDISTFNVVEANRIMLGAEFSVGALVDLGLGQQLMVGAFYEVGHSFFGEQAAVQDRSDEIEPLSEASTRLVGFKTAWLFRRMKKNKTNSRDGRQKPKGKERAVKPAKRRKIKN